MLVSLRCIESAIEKDIHHDLLVHPLSTLCPVIERTSSTFCQQMVIQSECF